MVRPRLTECKLYPKPEIWPTFKPPESQEMSTPRYTKTSSFRGHVIYSYCLSGLFKEMSQNQNSFPTDKKNHIDYRNRFPTD